MKTCINFFDVFKVALTGKGDRRRKLEKYYENQIIQSKDWDLEIVFREVNPDPEVILGDPGKYYGKEEDKFILKKDDNILCINKDWSKFVCNPNISEWMINPIIESLVRLKISSNGYSFVHGSCINYKGKTIIFPAWRHTGKTNTLLTFLEESADYLSDDRLPVSPSGDVLGFKLPIHLMSYNAQSFPDLISSKKFEYRFKMFEKIDNYTINTGSKFLKGVRLFNRAYIRDSYYLDVNSNFPKSEYIEKDKLDAIVLLQTTPNKDVFLDVAEKSLVENMLVSINFHEWDDRAEDVFKAHSGLFPESNKRQQISDLKDHDSSVFESLVENIPVYRMNVPREKDWDSENIKPKLISELEEIFTEI